MRINTIVFMYMVLLAPLCWSQTQVGENEVMGNNEIVVDVLFDADNNSIGDDSKEALAGHAETLITEPDVSVTIQGYSDLTGDPDSNVVLSKRRADSVKEYLVSRGVPEDNISVEPKGGTDRFSKGNSPEALGANRRARVIYKLPVISPGDELGGSESSDDREEKLSVVKEPAPTPGPTPNPTPPAELLEAIELEINNTSAKGFLLDVPKHMQLEGTYLVQAVVNDDYVSTLSKGVANESRVKGLKLSDDILLLLSGPGFDVRPVDDTVDSKELFPDDLGAQSESLPPARDVSWKWYVTPLKAGYQPLKLSIVVDIDKPEYTQVNNEYPIYVKVINVKEGFVRSLIGSYWILSFLILIVLAIVSWVILGRFNMI